MRRLVMDMHRIKQGQQGIDIGKTAFHGVSSSNSLMISGGTVFARRAGSLSSCIMGLLLLQAVRRLGEGFADGG